MSPELCLSGEFLAYRLGAQRFGLRLPDVVEVVRAVALTPMPGAPDFVEGAIDARGRVVPVVDLRARFALSTKPIEPRDHMILARCGDRVVALRVDAAEELITIPDDAVAAATELVGARAPIEGVARLSDGLVLIHDLERLLSQAEREALDLALGGHAVDAEAAADVDADAEAGEAR